MLTLSSLPRCQDAAYCWHAVEGPRENRAALVACPGWDEWLLELLLDGSPCIPAASQQQPAQQVQARACPSAYLAVFSRAAQKQVQ